MKYETEENNPGWLNKGPWYNKSICYNMHGIIFECFIRNSRTYRYNLMCYITAHDRQQPIYVDDISSAGGKTIPKNATTVAIKSLGATLNFIDCWLRHFQHNYQEIL